MRKELEQLAICIAETLRSALDKMGQQVKIVEVKQDNSDQRLNSLEDRIKTLERARVGYEE